VQFFAGDLNIPRCPPRVTEWFDRFAAYDVDFADVRGQEAANRAVCVAAAGGAGEEEEAGWVEQRVR
jgi:predicted ATPase with chaperone activity